MPKQMISVLVENHAGVLARISSLFGRRGFNIDSLSVAATHDPTLSRITIATHGDAAELQQILEQSAKLLETRAVFRVDPAEAVLRELLLVKVEAGETQRAPLREIATIFKAKVIDLAPTSLILELTGEAQKIDAFLVMLQNYRILELCRTGLTAMERGITEHPLKPRVLPESIQ